ncbi:uncharacterized protein LOC130753655 [Actinidia eriantha]|uniref:uncharacterized protein LOC130753655 n=1 Tax=Actinidia eriantha TaxID=165200 RepID=UPI002585A204|nr:uncharacterized protein LOC130753655 [Actinidia eriantha]
MAAGAVPRIALRQSSQVTRKIDIIPHSVLPATSSVAVASPNMIPPVVLVNHGEKPEKFNEIEFKRWQQKMLFYLTTLNFARFINESIPVLTEETTTTKSVVAVDAWNHADFLCWNYILNGLENILYNVYSPIKIAKELWDSLDKKYKTKDVRAKKFVVSKFLEYMMVDSKSVINQVQEIQLILHDIHAEVMSIGFKQGPKSDGNKNAKFQGKYFKCDKIGHHAAECQSKPKDGYANKKLAQANVTEVEDLSDGISDMHLSVIVSEVNIIGSNPKNGEWTLELLVISSDKRMFTSYNEVKNGEQLYLGNSATSVVERKGTVVLKMSSEK